MRQTIVVSAFLVVSGCFPGCGSSGPELAGVTGTVTLDGKPLPNATVTFIPEASATPAGGESLRIATATTDEDGYYRMEFSTDRTGVQPGKYKVAVSTFRSAEENAEGEMDPGAAETVPDVYNRKTTLTADVPSGGDEFDFDLKSDAGDIVQPPPTSDRDDDE